MPIHTGDIYTLQRIAEGRRSEAVRRAERQRLTGSKAPATKARAAVATTLRGLADRLAPRPSSEAPATGGG